jgi:hypothetical protein
VIDVYIDDAGFHRDRLPDVLAKLTAAARGIFGSDIVLTSDTQDGQLLGAFCEAIDDCLQGLEACFNARNPNAATGAALASTCLLNGVVKAPGQFATIPLSLGTLNGATIPAGTLVADVVTGSQYALDAVVTGTGGAVATTATATAKGTPVSIAANVTKIVNPTYGLLSVVGTSNSSGYDSPEESPEQLRIRRGLSTAAPSQSLTDSVRAAVMALANHPRVRVWENTLDQWADAKGTDRVLPPHSIAVVVELDSVGVAPAILATKGQGCGTAGTTIISLSDTAGEPQVIRYTLATQVKKVIAITYKEIAGQGFGGVAGETLVQIALANWINANQGIGQDVVRSMLYDPINGARLGINGLPSIDVQSLTINGAAADYAVAYNEMFHVDVVVDGSGNVTGLTDPTKITLTVVS